MSKTSKECLFKQKDKKTPVTGKEVTLQDCLQTLLLTLFIVKFYGYFSDVISNDIA